jgi:hypothetical protein
MDTRVRTAYTALIHQTSRFASGDIEVGESESLKAQCGQYLSVSRPQGSDTAAGGEEESETLQSLPSFLESLESLANLITGLERAGV